MNRNKAHVRNINKNTIQGIRDRKYRLFLFNSKNGREHQDKKKESSHHAYAATIKGIANVFAELYKDLYSSENDETETNKAAKQDLKTLVTILTKTLKTMCKTDTP